MNAFLLKTKEDEKLNQYWYSAKTIDAMVKEIQAEASTSSPKICACLSTPSVFFSLPMEIRKQSMVFDLDEKFGQKDASTFCMYDFNFPEKIPQELHHKFSYIVIDPPFITPEVWKKYAEAAKLLGSDKFKVLLSTIPENATLLKTLLNAEVVAFMPSIPHLVYQYNFFTNYTSSLLSSKNPEIPE